MIVVIDNYDSFTYNLVQYLGELGVSPTVFRNDQISVEELRALNPKGIVISPGPCTPSEAGISVDLIEELHETIPILGVCLGHQSIGIAFGGRVVSAKTIVHGKTSNILHDQKGIFENIPSPFDATRYHSLVVDRNTLPEVLEITAWTEDETIMGIRHSIFPVVGVQFHPESIATQHGRRLLRNFLNLTNQSMRRKKG
jgi:anthranilate synthase/aminodeoxychorismate synthase-like glutamine amidotransferase